MDLVESEIRHRRHPKERDLNTTPRFLLALSSTLPIGVLVAVQSRINGQLGHDLDDGVLAALISFGGGLLLVTVVVAALPGGRRGTRRIIAAVADGELPRGLLLGGLGGALLVASQGLTIGVLGVAVFTVAVVAGQTTSGLFVDRAGLGPAGPTPITPIRVLGAVLAMIAVLIAVLPDLGRPGFLIYALLPAVAGATLAWQSAVNGRVGVVSGAALPPAMVNFAVGTAALTLVGVVDVAVRGWPSSLPTDPVLYLGGALGVVFVAVATVVVRVIGVLLLGLGVVAGQLAGALAVDLLFPTGPAGVSVWDLIGAGLTLLAVLIAAADHRPAAPGGRHDRDPTALTE